MEIPRNSLQKSSLVSYDKNSAQDIATILLSTCFFEKNVTSTNELDVKDAGLKLFKGWLQFFSTGSRDHRFAQCVISVCVCGFMGDSHHVMR